MEVQTVSAIESINGISAEAWNGMRQQNFPFSRHEHLRILETTQCLGKRTGWFPTYLCIGTKASFGPAVEPPTQTRAATWFYQKTNSYGEFVFDHEWADLYERCGRPYYPKAVVAVPFTPATGSKLLGDPAAVSHLLGAMCQIAKRHGNSSLHHLFLPGGQKALFLEQGYALRTGVQFHWRNRDYASFADFLQQLKKKRRKEISYERRNIDSDLEIRLLSGSDLSPQWADFAYDLYQKTNLEKMSFVCLTRAYFQELFAMMRPYVQFFVAQKRGNGQPVAGALFLTEGASMFGRYWGAVEERRYLHFELCYYAPIESAIHSGIQTLEAGAQGSHKISRGFLPTFTYSAHQFFESRIQEAFSEFCVHEVEQINAGLANYNDHFPYQQGNVFVDAGTL